MMAARKIVSFKMPVDVLECLDARAAEEGVSRSEAMFRLLGVALAVPAIPEPAALPPRARPAGREPRLFLFEGNAIAGSMTLTEFAESGLSMEALSDSDRAEHGEWIARTRAGAVG